VPTALVTGATAGIGAAFARLLAREGYDLVLVARDAERLEGVATELRASSTRPSEGTLSDGVSVEVLAADLTDDGQRQRVEQRLADSSRPIEVLVNNAGISTPRGFVRGSVEDEERLLRLNVLAPMRLAKAVVPGMVERSRGAVINVSSVAGFLPYSMYSASKAWVTSFSEALAVELDGTGVRVVALCPGMVRTEFHERAGMDVSNIPGWSWLDSDAVAAAGWRGVTTGRVLVVPSPLYRALVTVLRHLPPRLSLRVARSTRQRRRRPR